MITIEDSLCLIQKDDVQNVTGMLLGYGKAFLREIEKRILQNGASHMELLSVNDEHHNHFYTEFGMYAAKNLKIMGKHYAPN